MNANAWIALLAVAITPATLFYVRRSANASRLQTQLQRQLRIDAAQPYVWVDLRPDEEHGQFLLLIIGNSGPTVATQVKVTFEPQLEIPRVGNSRGDEARDLLARGIASLPPGREMKWLLGVTSQLISGGYALAYTATVRAHGPFGEIRPLTYTIHLDDLRHTLAVPNGTLNGVAGAVASLTAAVEAAKAELHATSASRVRPEVG
jgi:hypothetical protein